MSVEPKQVKQKVASSGRSFLEWGDTLLKMPPAKRIEMIRGGVKVALLIGAGQYYGISQIFVAGCTSTPVVNDRAAFDSVFQQPIEKVQR